MKGIHYKLKEGGSRMDNSKGNVSKENVSKEDVVVFESFEEIEDIVTATGKGSLACC